MEEDETYSTQGPICPFCNHKHVAGDDVYYEDGNLDCSSCGKTFEMNVYTEISWTCTKPK